MPTPPPMPVPQPGTNGQTRGTTSPSCRSRPDLAHGMRQKESGSWNQPSPTSGSSSSGQILLAHPCSPPPPLPPTRPCPPPLPLPPTLSPAPQPHTPRPASFPPAFLLPLVLCSPCCPGPQALRVGGPPSTAGEGGGASAGQTRCKVPGGGTVPGWVGGWVGNASTAARRGGGGWTRGGGAVPGGQRRHRSEERWGMNQTCGSMGPVARSVKSWLAKHRPRALWPPGGSSGACGGKRQSSRGAALEEHSASGVGRAPGRRQQGWRSGR